MRPNIFEFATKELSQDAFLAWLVKWGNPSYKDLDSELNECSQRFITELIRKMHPDFKEIISSLNVERQKNNIDIWVEINNKYVLIIEDKTNTEQHGQQLDRYSNYAKDWLKHKDSFLKEPICIYLKTGNESKSSLKQVIEKGYQIIDRKQLIEILKPTESTNDIFIDFYTRLVSLEKNVNQWEDKFIKDWNTSDWQGFFMFLEENLGLVNWKYVSNKSGGFWNAVLNWQYIKQYPIYIQLEQDKLCFKISTHPDDGVVLDEPINKSKTKVRNDLSLRVRRFAKDRGLTAVRRPKFGHGNYMTIALVEATDWLSGYDKKINVHNTLETLTRYNKLIKEFVAT